MVNGPQNGTRGKVTTKCNLELHGYLIIKGSDYYKGYHGMQLVGCFDGRVKMAGVESPS